MLRGTDVSACVHQLALRWGPPQPLTTAPLSPEGQRRIREAQRWRDEAIARIVASHPGSVLARNVEDTVDAIARGVDVIADPRLPDDDEGHRRATVHALVRVGRRGESFTYAPVIVRNAEIVEPSSTRQLPVTSLESLSPMTATVRGGVAPRASVTRYGLSLVHTLEMLAANGHADAHRRGALVDRQGEVWWFHLGNDDHPRFNHEVYGHQYRERLAVLEAHERWSRDGGDFPTRPAWHRACDACDFAAVCEAELSVADDVSLVRFTNFEQQELLRDHGVTTRVQLAALDPVRAAKARDLPGQALAADAGVEEHLGRQVTKLDELIYRARVSVAGSYLRIGPAEATSCPTADVEIDVDMESYNDVTYFWGAAVRCAPHVTGVSEGYQAFVSFEPLTDEVEARVFADFWEWFAEVRRVTLDQGATFAAYCFWAHAEDSAMNRALVNQPVGGITRDEVDVFRRSPGQWVDIYAVVKEQIQTDGPLGLKQVAKAAGFDWRDEAPGGEASMTWYETAVGDDDAAHAARARLLAYNEDDCLATRALRDWLNGPARALPSRDEPR